jgi:tape measure domain-containing protein
MADSLEFIYRAIDKYSGPLKAMRRETSALERQIKRVGALNVGNLTQRRGRAPATRLGSAGRLGGGLGGSSVQRQIDREKAGMLRDAERAASRIARIEQRRQQAGEDYLYRLRMRHFGQQHRQQLAASKALVRSETTAKRASEQASARAGRLASRARLAARAEAVAITRRLYPGKPGGNAGGRSGARGLPFGPLGPGSSALGSITSGLMSVAKWGAIAGAALGGLFVGSVFQANDFHNKMQMAFTNLTGDAGTATATIDKTISTARRLGLGVENSITQVRSLLAKGFDPSEANEMLRLVGDLQTIGVEGQASDRVLVALTQIKAKGRLQAEEMLQLNEAGIGSIQIYKQLEKQLGKTNPEVRAMQEQGNITAEMALAAVKSATLLLTGKSELGQAAEQFAKGTIRGRINKALGAWEDKKKSISKLVAGDDIIKQLARVETFINRINPNKFGKLFESLVTLGVKAFEFLSTATEGFINGFTAKFDEIGGGAFFDGLLGDKGLTGISKGFETIGTVIASVGILATQFFGAFFNRLGENTEQGNILGGTLANITSPASLEAMRKFGSILADVASVMLDLASAAVTMAGAIGGGITGGVTGAAIGSVFGPIGTAVGGVVGAVGGMLGGAAYAGSGSDAKQRREPRLSPGPIAQNLDRSVTVGNVNVHVTDRSGAGDSPNSRGRELGRGFAQQLRQEAAAGVLNGSEGF